MFKKRSNSVHARKANETAAEALPEEEAAAGGGAIADTIAQQNLRKRYKKILC